MDKNRRTLVEFIILTSILIISFIVRWQHIESVPYGVEGDEFSIINTSYLNQYGILGADKGLWSLHDTNATSFPVTIKSNQLSFSLFGVDFLSPRKMLVIVSVSSLLFFYLLLRYFFSYIPALFTLLLYSVSSYKLMTTRIVLQSSFTDLFVFLALFLALQGIVSRKNILLFLAGCTTVLSIYSYNLNYLLPGIVLFVIIVISLQNKFDLKRMLLFATLFLLPIVLSAPHWLPKIMVEKQAKDYALINSVLKSKNIKEASRLTKLNSRAILAKFIPSQQSTGDMLYLNGVLFNPAINMLFLVGLLWSILEVKKYFPLLLYFGSNIIVYHFLLGLNFVRMWFVTYGLVYCFVGLALYKLINVLMKKFRPQLLWVSLSLIIFYFTINYEIKIYNYSLTNPSYKILHREEFELTKLYQKNLANDLIFIVPDITSARIGELNAASTFYYLKNHNDKADVSVLKTSGREFFNIITIDEFNANLKKILMNKVFIITEVSIDKIISDKLKKIGFNIQKRLENFTVWSSSST